MKTHLMNFKEFLKTPFPYMFVALCLFLSSTMLTNESFYGALKNQEVSNANSSSAYTLCLVCSDPAAKDVLGDLGFTVANFVLFPVSALAFLLKSVVPYMFGIYIALSAVYGLVMPFLLFIVYGLIDMRLAKETGETNVYTG